jgi:hypothetical protein
MTKEWEGPVYLEPIAHKYHHRDTKRIYSSVTQTLHSLVNVFEEDKVAEAISKQNPEKQKPEYRGLTKPQIIEYWRRLNDEANEYGTFIHETIEEYLLKQKVFFPDDELQQKTIKAFDEMNIDEGQTVWPERIMFSEEHELAGTADLVIDIDDVYFDIGDFKTNKKFDYHDAFGHKTLKKPLDHLQDCHYSIYSVQLSIYALMYEMETGRKCRKNYILYWNRVTEKFEYIPVPYYKNEARKVLDLHKYNQQFAL